MDFSINKIHQFLLDAGLPSTIEDLKCPTQDYVVNLFTAFLARYNIDINLIDQPVPEQYNAMAYHEDSDIINLINLHAVLTQIFNKIFLQDFYLVDMTNPGPKRFRKQAKYLSNFVLYTMHKQTDINDRIEQIESKRKLLEELKEQKAQNMESINNMLMCKAKQLSIIEKLNDDAQSVKLRIEKLNKRELELEVIQINVDKEHRQMKEIHSSLKTTVGELCKSIADLKSEIVHSPEEHQSKLEKLEEENKLKEEERATMQEAIQEKKRSIKQIEEISNIFQKINDEPLTYKYAYKEMKDKKANSDDIKRQFDAVKHIWDEKQTKLATLKDRVNIETKTLQSYREENIIPLLNLHKQLLSEKSVLKAKHNEIKNCCFEKYLERDKVNAEIKKIEEETTRLQYKWQEMYDNIIADECELRCFDDCR